MLKVIIADDEARVCRLIQMLADWERLGMEVAGTAANGLEALKLVQTHRPDILITDIRMPGCHGLELIQQAKSRYPQLEIIIISGYAHFEYAQCAIKYGVGDYLLKPINREELMATLEKLGDRCRRRRQSDTEVEQLRQTSRADVERLHSRLLLDLVQRRLAPPTAQQLWMEYHFQIQPGLLQMMFLKMDYAPAVFSPNSISVIQEKTEKVFRGELHSLCHGVILAFRDSWGYGLLNYAPAQKDAVRRHLRDALNHLMAERALYGEIEFSLALSPAVHGPEELPQSVREAGAVIAERLTVGTGRLLERVPEPSGILKDQILERYRRGVTEGVESLSQEGVRQAALALERETRGVPRVRGGELLELAVSAGKVFLLRLEAENQEQLLRDFELKCDQCSRPEQLFHCLRSFQEEQLAQRKDQLASEAIRPIRIAKQFIEKNYSRSITLEDVSAATGFSVSYFSALFKKEMGEGFAKYLTRVRVDRAKELLQQTDLPITEICHRVGYNDLKHFAQTFKKATSLNPGQYRRLYG